MRHDDARADVVAQSHRAHEMRPVNAELLPSRQRRGHHGDARMRARRGMRIVRFVGMRQHPIGERRLDRAAQDVGADHRRDFFAAVAFAANLIAARPGGSSEPEIMAANVSRM